jgi:hypothetical protein
MIRPSGGRLVNHGAALSDDDEKEREKTFVIVVLSDGKAKK